jgi:hypothetical protein
MDDPTVSRRLAHAFNVANLDRPARAAFAREFEGARSVEEFSPALRALLDSV